jgi:hypothetical protein
VNPDPFVFTSRGDPDANLAEKLTFDKTVHFLDTGRTLTKS